MKFFCILIILSFVVIAASCSRALESVCGPTSITEVEAKETAKSRLEKFAAGEGIDSAIFAEPTAYKQDDILWVVDYNTNQANSQSYYFFRVIIDNCGMIETNYDHQEAKQATDNEPQIIQPQNPPPKTQKSKTKVQSPKTGN